MSESQTPAQQYATNLRTLALYLMGYYDACENVNTPFLLPTFLTKTVSACFDYCASEDEKQQHEAGDFERGGKWHRAANILMRDIDKKAQRMTELTHEYPVKMPWGDAMCFALLNTQRAAHGEACKGGW